MALQITVTGDEKEHPEQLAALLHSLLQIANIPVELRAPPFDGVTACARLLRVATEQPIKFAVVKPPF